MGYYIDGPTKGKVAHIIKTYNATVVDKETAEMAVDSHGVIVVLDNGPFEAAGYAFNDKEFKEFTEPRDRRPKTFLLMDKKLAEKESGFNG